MEREGALASLFHLPSVPRALSFPSSPGSARLLFTSPRFPAYEKMKEASAEESQKTKTKVTTLANHMTIQGTNQNSKQKPGTKRGKTSMSESRLVFGVDF